MAVKSINGAISNGDLNFEENKHTNRIENEGDRDYYRWVVSEAISQEGTHELSPGQQEENMPGQTL